MQTSIDLPVSTPINRVIQSSEFYEAASEVDETVLSNYWYLGVSYLLSEREDDAQAAWYVPLAAADEQESDIYTNQLVTILEQAAIDQSKTLNLEPAGPNVV